MEYELIWDGNRNGTNRGLLGVAAEILREPEAMKPEPRSGRHVVGPHGSSVQAVEAALPAEWMSVRAIADLLNLPPQNVRDALQGLWKRGIVERRLEIGTLAVNGETPVRYRKVSA